MILERQLGPQASIFESDRVAAVYAYYDGLRGNRAMPSREDVDPAAIKHHLPYLYIAKVVHLPSDDVRFQITLMGTELVQILKLEGRNQFIIDLDLGGFEKSWRKSIKMAFETKLPMVAVDRIQMKNGLHLECEHLALPLSADNNNVDRIFGCFDFPQFSEARMHTIKDRVDWSDSLQVRVPKRLLIPKLDTPQD